MAQRVFLLLCSWAFWALACGQLDRSNPEDPRVGGSEGEGFRLVAELPEAYRAEIVERIAEIRYRVNAIDMARPIEGPMNLIGTSARALVSGVAPGADRTFAVVAVDDNGIPTFAAAETLAVVAQESAPIVLQMRRLLGSIELVSELPPEIVLLEISIATGGDTLLSQYEVDGPLTQRIIDIPTGSDIWVTLRGFDAEEQVLVQDQVRTDIREDLVAHLSLAIFGGSLQIVARFPTYLPIVAIDRFSDEMGTFFRRSDNPDLPAPNEAIDFDIPRFLLRAFGPNGEATTFYHFDVRPKEPGKVYEFVGRRGEKIVGQLPVFDRIPGDADYSDFWQLHTVRVLDREYRANSLYSVEDVLATEWELIASEDIINAVMVPAGSRAARRFDPLVPAGTLDGWYRGQIVKYLLFESPQSVAQIDFAAGQINTPQMYAFFDNGRDEKDGFALDQDSGITHNVMTRLPGEEGYSPLWVLQVFVLEAFARVGDLASALDQAKNEENFVDLGKLVFVNAPIVQVGAE